MSNLLPTGPNQQKLLDVIISGQHSEAFDSRGLDIYRRNLAAAAARSLSTSFPTLNCLVGEQMTAVLARDYLRAHGRSVFDWGQWGGDFSDWLQGHSLSRQYPYLPDCARLDWCIHRAERAPDPLLNFQSFSVLERIEDFNFALEFTSGVSLIRSAYPIVAIYQAHRKRNIDPDLDEARTLLKSGRGQCALVWRQGLYTQVREVSVEENIWFRLLDGGATTVTEVLRDADSAAMPFEDWLERAISEQLVTGLRQAMTFS